MFRSIITLILCQMALPFFAQLSFTSKTGDYHRNGSWNGVAAGFCDINGDLSDDLILMNKGRIMEIGYNQGQNALLRWTEGLQVFHNPETAMTIGDLDNDGKPEIIVNGISSEVKVYKINDQGNPYLYYKVPVFIYSQAANLVDINNDGYLDLFICNDESDSVVLLNDKTGQLYAEYVIDFNTVPTSDNSGSYGSEWIDIDNDNDQDLYIAKCRFGINDLEDPRRHNMLFINNNGTFTNEAEIRGMKNKSQSWTGSFADFENDGDFDCLITNHDSDHVMMQNDGNGYFTPYPTNITFNKSFSFQSLLADYDNNGYVDILITGADVVDLYLNLDGFNFEKTDLFSDDAFSSATIGDLNEDGCIDVVAYYSKGIIEPGNKRDEIYINDGNSNHYVKFTLKGKTSNASAVGARIVLYSNSGKKIRQVQAGVSYGITNTLTQHFGLANDAIIDSIEVIWPSGLKEKHYDLDANEHYMIEEGGCLSRRFELLTDKAFLCKNDEVKVFTPVSYQQYIWNNEETEDTLIAQTQGPVFVLATDNEGCHHPSQLLNIQSQSLEGKSLALPAVDTHFICKGDTLVLRKNEFAESITWPDGQNGAEIKWTNEGDFPLEAIDVCGDNFSGQFSVRYVTDLSDLSIALKPEQDSLVSIDGQQVTWYADRDKTEILSQSNSFLIPQVEDSTTYYVSVTNKRGETNAEIGIKALPQSNQYASDQIDAGLYFNAFDDVTLKSFLTRTDRAGLRRFLIIKYEGDTIFSKDVMLEKDTNTRVILNAYIPAGTLYQLKTDHNINLQNFGFEGPRLYRANTNISYPYLAGRYAEIPVSTKGAAAYYYFFDIQLEYGGTTCSEDIDILVTPDTTTSIIDFEDISADAIYPNPTKASFFVRDHDVYYLEVYSCEGKILVKQAMAKGEMVDVSALAPGLYLVQLHRRNQKPRWAKLMVFQP